MTDSFKIYAPSFGWPMIGSMLSLLFAGVCISALQPYQSVVALDALQMDATFYSTMVLASSAVSIVVALQIGHLSDLIGNRHSLLLGSAFCGGVGYLLMFLYPGNLVFCMSVVIITPIASALSQQIYALLHSDARLDRGFVTAVGRATFAMSWVVTAPIAVLLVSLYGDMFVIYALSAAACFLIAIVYSPRALKARDQFPQKEPSPNTNKIAFGSGLRNHVMPILSCSLFRAALRLNALALGPLALSVGGTIGSIGFVTAFCALLEVPLIVLWGFLTKFIQKKVLLSCGAVISAIYFAAVTVANTVTVLYVVTPLAAIGGAAIFSVSISYFQDRMPDRVGFATSLNSVTSFVGSCIASLVFALSFDQFGPHSIFLAGASLMLLGGIVVLRT